jgi:hypothetical protein
MVKAQLRVEVQGGEQVRRKLRRLGDTDLAAEYRAGLEGLARTGVMRARGRAPVHSGLTRAKLGSKLQASPIPKWAKVQTTATRTSARYKRFSYPSLQEFSPRSKHRGWLRDVLHGMRGQVQSTMDQVARKVERRWAR